MRKDSINWRTRRRRQTRNAPLNVENNERVKRSRRLLRLAQFGLLGLILLVVGTFIALPLLAFNLPSPDEVVRREGFSTRIMDRNGEQLYDIFDEERRTPIDVNDVPSYLKQATIAIEDKTFYEHQGFDLLGIMRGLSRQFTHGRAQGGSTLTQQLVKNVLLTSERSATRKVNEFILAIQIERRYSKDEILQMYLNEAPYGSNTRGVEAAGELYFGKTVKDLGLIESAILAGLPQRPSAYSPHTGEKGAYIPRTEAVLRRMREDGYITEEQERLAVEQLPNVVFRARGSDFKAPHFVQYVQKLIEDKYGEEAIEQGLRVTTTLDLALQEKAQTIVKEEIDKVKSQKITNGASVILNPQTGEIMAMVGSRGFDDPEIDGQVNVTTALRQPGSSIKPITYVAGFKEGFTASSLLMDVETEFPAGPGQPMYIPKNYDGKFRGPVQVRYALANSLNIPAVKMVALVGIKDMLQTSYDLGLTSLEPTKANLSRFGLSITLGGGEVRLTELTAAYGAFMNTGHMLEPIAILRVEDINGKVLENNNPEKGKRVLAPEQAYLITDILSDNQARSATFGLNSALNIPGRQIAVKTGTTNDRRDNWTIGGSPQIVVGVWVGNNDNSPMGQLVSGVSGAAPIWRKIILAAHEGKPSVNFERPGGIVEAEVDTISGFVAHDGFPSRKEIFAGGTEPREDTVHLKLKLCRGDNKLATPSDIAANNFEEREFFVFKENDPVSTDGKNRWQEAIDKWKGSDPKYNPPTDYCGTAVPVNVDFVTPRDRDSNLASDFVVEVRADSTSRIAALELEVDGNRVRTFDRPPYRYEASLTTGVHTLRAVARDENGKTSERIITIGVGTQWDANVTPTQAP